MKDFKKDKLKRQRSVGLYAPLRKGETGKETIGCRRGNPATCQKNSLEGVCAFVRGDNICKAPPVSWEKRYLEIKSNPENAR